MPNVGDIIRAEDFSGAGFEAGAVVPFYKVTLSGRYPIFWGKSEADTSWLVCDGGDDLHGGNVPDLRDRFIMGVVSVDEANKTGGSSDITVDSTTLTTEQISSHNHLTRWTAANASKPYLASSTYVSWPGGWAQLSGGAYSDNTGGSQSHTHSFSGTVMPPYYSLIYLVKLP